MYEKKLLTVFLIVLILFGISVRILSLNKEFNAEEVSFVKAGSALKNTGRPVYYHSEQLPSETALWHPPMYIFLLSFIFRFITEEIGARIINTFFLILTSVLIFLFCTKIIEGEKGKIIGLLSSTFFLINFYVLSSSILIDIDILSCFFVFSFIFFVLMYSKKLNNYFLLLAGLSFFFSLANRYPIAIMVYFFVGIYYFINKELRRDFKKYLLMGIISIFCFVLLWWVYSTIIEPGNFFSFLKHNAGMGLTQFSNVGVYFGSFVLNITQLIRLITFPAIIMIIWSFFYFFRSNSKLIKLLLLYTLPVLLFFIIIPRPAFGYPRYFISLFPSISILLGIFLYENLKGLELNKTKVLIILLSFFVSLSLLIILNPQTTLYTNNGLIKATNLPDFLFNVFASIPIFCIFLFKEKERNKILIIVLASLLLAYSLYFDLNLLNTKIFTKEAGEYINSITNESEVIIMPMSVGYYSERRYYANDFYKPPINNISIRFLKDYITKSFYNRDMDEEFFWNGGVYSGTSFSIYNPSIKILEKASYVVLDYRLNDKNYTKKIGNFYIYNLTSSQ